MTNDDQRIQRLHGAPTSPMWNGGSRRAITRAVGDSRRPVDSLLTLAARVVAERRRNAPVESGESLRASALCGALPA